MLRNENETNKDEKYQSPEDAYAFGRLLVYMFADWNLAWKLNFFPMRQVQRYVKPYDIRV